MKINIGGNISITLMNEPYSPVRCESIFTVEKDLDKEANYEELQDKINKLLEKDLEKKIKIAFKKQNELKHKLKEGL